LGLTGFLEVMIPVAAIVAGIMVMEKLEKVALDNAKAFAETAVETNKLNDKLLDAREKFLGLTQGPVAEAAQKVKDFGLRTNELAALLPGAMKVMEANTTVWAHFVQGVQHATDVVQHYFAVVGRPQLQVGPGAIPSPQESLDDKQVETRLQGIVALSTANHQYASALAEVRAIEDQLNAAGPLGVQQAKGVQVYESQIMQAKAAYESEKKNAEKEEGEKAESQADAHAEALATIAANAAKTKGDISKSEAETQVKLAEGLLTRLKSSDKALVESADSVETKTTASVNNALDVKLRAISREEVAESSLIALKKTAAEVEAQAKRDEALATEKKGLAGLSSDPAKAQESADKRREFDAVYANAVKVINVELANQFKLLDDQVSTAHQQAELKKTEATDKNAKERVKLEEDAQKEIQRLQMEAFKEQEKGIQRTLELSLKQAKPAPSLYPTGVGKMVEEDHEAAAYKRAADALIPLIAEEKTHLQELTDMQDVADLSEGQGAGDKFQSDISALQDSLSAQIAMQDQYKQHVIELQNEIKQNQLDALRTMTDAFNSGMMSWMQGHERFGRAMMQTWMSIASTAVGSIMKIAEANLMNLAMHGLTAEKDIFISAKQAAGRAMSEFPFPINIAMAAAAFAGTMALASFDLGGIMPDDGAGFLHKNEMVLPPRLSQFVQNAAINAQGSEGGAGGEGGKGGEGGRGADTDAGESHFHFSPQSTYNINATDRSGMEDALREHGELIFTMWKQQMRARNLI
jgi:hypothetical protein